MHTAQNTITLDMPATLREKLTAAAKAAGLSLEAYAAALLTQAARRALTEAAPAPATGRICVDLGQEDTEAIERVAARAGATPADFIKHAVRASLNNIPISRKEVAR